MEKLNRIVINPNICLGQPTIRGMRITVAFVAFKEILQEARLILCSCKVLGANSAVG